MVPLVPRWVRKPDVLDYIDPVGQAETLIGKKKKVRLLIINKLYILQAHTHHPPKQHTSKAWQHDIKGQ